MYITKTAASKIDRTQILSTSYAFANGVYVFSKIITSRLMDIYNNPTPENKEELKEVFWDNEVSHIEKIMKSFEPVLRALESADEITKKSSRPLLLEDAENASKACDEIVVNPRSIGDMELVNKINQLKVKIKGYCARIKNAVT